MSDQQSRLVQLEELVMHQDHMLQQLHEVVLELRGDYDSWRARTQQQLDRLESLSEERSSPPDPSEKPPHY